MVTFALTLTFITCPLATISPATGISQPEVHFSAKNKLYTGSHPMIGFQPIISDLRRCGIVHKDEHLVQQCDAAPPIRARPCGCPGRSGCNASAKIELEYSQRS